MKINEVKDKIKKKRRERAGIYPVYIDPNGELWVCLMIPSDPAYGGPQPQMGKGRVDDGQTIEEAAIREGEEELGLRMDNMGPVEFLESKTISGLLTEYELHVYTTKVKDPKAFNTPHHESSWAGFMKIDEALSQTRENQRSCLELVKQKYAGSELTESAAGQYVYHSTKAENLGAIMQKGLTFFNDSLWVKADNPDERYQDGPSVFAFENPMPAFRWAHKIEWEYKTPAVIIKFKRGSSWEQDPSPDFTMTMGDGQALESKEMIPVGDMEGVILLSKLGSPVSNDMTSQEFDDYVAKTLEAL